MKRNSPFPFPRRAVALALAGLTWTACAAGSSSGSASDPAPRIVVDFDADWMFSRGDFADAAMPAFDDCAWRWVNVPHDWSNKGPFGPKYGSGNGYAPGGVGWYRKLFTLDSTQKDRLVSIEFDGVYDHAQVWINGQYVGGRPYGYASFQLDLSRHLNFGGENVIAVRVDHSRFADSRWYTGSGMYRHVRLCITDKLHIGPWGVFITTPTISDESALVRIETNLVNASDGPRVYSLRSEVIEPGGSVVAFRTDTGRIAAGQSRILLQEIEVAKPRRWSIESPVLYVMRSCVGVTGTLVDETMTLFGIRKLTFDPDRGFLLNDKPIKLKGVCIHHDAGSLGAAVPDKVLERRLRLLQELGVNAVRTSHNPPAPELLDLCDRLGMLVKDEAFDEFTPPKNKWVFGWNVGLPSKFGYGEIFNEWAVRDIEDMVRRDRNHPSVIMWSIGNEIDYPNDPFSHPILGDRYHPQNPPAENLVRYAAPLITAIKRFDSTRPVTAGLAHLEMSDAVGLGEMLDIVGYNYQEQCYHDDHRHFPGRFIFGSENGHQYGAWTVVRDNPYVAGQFLWTGIDYLGEAHEWPNRGRSFGLLDLCGFKKPAAWFRQSLWSAKPMVYVCAASPNKPTGPPDETRISRLRLEEHWSWPKDSTVAVLCFSNCPSVEIRLNNRLIGEKRLTEAAEGVLTWTVPYESGTLTATGLVNGKPACDFTLRTAGPANRVELLPDTKRLRADGKDVCHIEFRIVDTNGVLVPDGSQTVTFNVEGPAEIIGIGNGDVNDVESTLDHEHRAFQGRGLVIIQSSKKAGKIILTASAQGLTSARVILTSR